MDIDPVKGKDPNNKERPKTTVYRALDNDLNDTSNNEEKITMEGIIEHFNPHSLDEIYQRSPSIRLGKDKSSMLDFKLISEDTVIFKGLEPEKSQEFINLMERTKKNLSSNNNGNSSSSAFNEGENDLGEVAFDFLHKEADITQLTLNDTVPVRPTWYGDFRTALTYTHQFAKTDPRNNNKNKNDPIADMYALVYKTTNSEPVLLLDMHSSKTRQNIGALFSEKWRKILDILNTMPFDENTKRSNLQENALRFYSTTTSNRNDGFYSVIDHDSGYFPKEWEDKRKRDDGVGAIMYINPDNHDMHICSENLQKFDIFFRHLIILCFGCGGNVITQIYSAIYLMLFTRLQFGRDVINGKGSSSSNTLKIREFENEVRHLFRRVLIERNLKNDWRFRSASSDTSKPLEFNIIFQIESLEYYTKISPVKEVIKNRITSYSSIVDKLVAKNNTNYHFLDEFLDYFTNTPVDDVNFDRFDMNGLSIKILVKNFTKNSNVLSAYNENGEFHNFNLSKLASLSPNYDIDTTPLFVNETSITKLSYISKQEAKSKVFYRNSEFKLDKRVIQYLCMFFSMVAVLQEEDSYLFSVDKSKNFITKGYIAPSIYPVSRYKIMNPKLLFGPEIALCWAPATIDLIGVLKMNMDTKSENYSGDVFLQNMYEKVIKKYMETRGIQTKYLDVQKFIGEYRKYIELANSKSEKYLAKKNSNTPILLPQNNNQVENSNTIAKASVEKFTGVIRELRKKLNKNVKSTKKRKRQPKLSDMDYDSDEFEDSDEFIPEPKKKKPRETKNILDTDEIDPNQTQQKESTEPGQNSKVIDLLDSDDDTPNNTNNNNNTVSRRIYNTNSTDMIIGFKYACDGCKGSFPKYKTSNGLYVCSRLCL